MERIKEISRGEGADSVIDCVGMEAVAGHGLMGALSKVQEKLTSTERPYVLERGDQGGAPRRDRLRARRLRRSRGAQHGQHRPEGPDVEKRPDAA